MITFIQSESILLKLNHNHPNILKVISKLRSKIIHGFDTHYFKYKDLRGLESLTKL